MPKRRTAAGFPKRNRLVGHSWTALQDQQKDIFHPPLFSRLAHEIVPDAPSLPPPLDNNDPRNPIDITPYIPVFEEVVDINKIAKHIARECLGKTNIDYEKKGRAEISRIVRQVSQFGSCPYSYVQKRSDPL